ncbi:MAG: DUF6261 family protein [Puniceicoccales bacterium]|jgi:hypothetical protein|nr:DUF6261 family protein [Puniceicoccales bacterium]
MNNVIIGINLYYLRNEEHFGFHSEITKLVEDYALNEAFQGLVTTYNGYYDELSEVLEVIRKSVLSKQLANTDKRRITIYRSLRGTAQRYLHHPETEKQLSAQRVYNVIRHYAKSILQGSRENRTYAIVNMIQDLRSGVPADLQLPGLTNWMTELEVENRAYQNLKNSRYEEQEKFPTQKIKVVRRMLDAAFHAITKYLEVQEMLNQGDENSRALIVSLNERVAFYKHLIAQRRGQLAWRSQLAETSSGSSSSTGLVEQMAG